MPVRAVVLLSGGMDSVTALYQTASEADVVLALSFEYGSKHNHKEIPFAEYHANQLGIPHSIIPLDFIAAHFNSNLLKSGGEIPEGHYQAETMKQTVVPFRNGIMLSIAAGIAESFRADELVIAAHAGDHAIYADCRPDFMHSMASAIQLGTDGQIHVSSPFLNIDKAGIVKIGAGLAVDYRMTWSCYKGGDFHCGRCGTCVERREAFTVAGIADPTDYEAEVAATE